jgi:hypothetical protein
LGWHLKATMYMKPDHSLVLLIALSACSPSSVFADELPENHRGEGRIYEKEARISFLPPKDWEQLKDEEGVVLVFRGPESQGSVTMNVKVQKGPPLSIEKMAPDIRKTVPAGVEGWKRLEDGFTEIDKRKAFYIDGKFTLNTVDPALEMKLRQYYFFGRERRIYVATFTGRADKFEAARKAIEQAAKSFRVD